jgi:hypothetical protein
MSRKISVVSFITLRLMGRLRRFCREYGRKERRWTLTETDEHSRAVEIREISQSAIED